jgi:hypothetical protein
MCTFLYASLSKYFSSGVTEDTFVAKSSFIVSHSTTTNLNNYSHGICYVMVALNPAILNAILYCLVRDSSTSGRPPFSIPWYSKYRPVANRRGPDSRFTPADSRRLEGIHCSYAKASANKKYFDIDIVVDHLHPLSTPFAEPLGGLDD